MVPVDRRLEDYDLMPGHSDWGSHRRGILVEATGPAVARVKWPLSVADFKSLTNWSPRS